MATYVGNKLTTQNPMMELQGHLGSGTDWWGGAFKALTAQYGLQVLCIYICVTLPAISLYCVMGYTFWVFFGGGGSDGVHSLLSLFGCAFFKNFLLLYILESQYVGLENVPQSLQLEALFQKRKSSFCTLC